MTNFLTHWKNYMTSSKEQMTKFKGEVCDYALNFLKEHSGYRWSDVLDYICEHWDLDNEFETLINECSQQDIGLPFEELCERRLYMPLTEPFIENLGLRLLTRFNNDLNKEL